MTSLTPVSLPTAPTRSTGSGEQAAMPVVALFIETYSFLSPINNIGHNGESTIDWQGVEQELWQKSRGYEQNHAVPI